MHRGISVFALFGYIILVSLSNASLPVRKPLSETVKYLQGEETKINGEQIKVEQTQLLLDTIWDKAGCSEAIDPNLCRGVCIK